jgi:hypothetical protein
MIAAIFMKLGRAPAIRVIFIGFWLFIIFFLTAEGAEV